MLELSGLKVFAAHCECFVYDTDLGNSCSVHRKSKREQATYK